MIIPRVLPLYFSTWKTVIDGDALYKYLGTGASFEAIAYTNNDKLSLQIRDNTLTVNALQPHSWALVFNEGRLVYPTLNQHDRGGRIHLEEDLEIKVVLFNNPPGDFIDAIKRLDEVMSLEKFNRFASSWDPSNVSLLSTKITRTKYPLKLWRGYRAHRKSCCSVACGYYCSLPVAIINLFLVMGIFVGIILLLIYHPSPHVPPPAQPPWVNIFGDIRVAGKSYICLSFLAGNDTSVGQKILSCLGYSCNCAIQYDWQPDPWGCYICN